MGEPGKYNFDALFTYNPALNFITPKYTVILGGVRLEQGTNIFPSTHTGGINLFSYIGKSITGRWDPVGRTLTILGFYQ